MANRGLTLAEMKDMMDNLADKVTEEGADLYQDIRERLDAMEDAASDKAEELAKELGPKFEALKARVSEEGREIIDMLEARTSMLMAEIHGEIAEFKEVGMVAWIKSNPMTAFGILLVVVALVGGAIKLLA